MGAIGLSEGALSEGDDSEYSPVNPANGILASDPVSTDSSTPCTVVSGSVGDRSGEGGSKGVSVS